MITEEQKQQYLRIYYAIMYNEDQKPSDLLLEAFPGCTMWDKKMNNGKFNHWYPTTPPKPRCCGR